MGFVGNLFNTGIGSGYQAQGALGASPVTKDQLESSDAATQQALSQQHAFAMSVAAQGGLGNQSNVFAQQQALAGQYGQMAQGQGPNPAALALQNATGQNVANQAALMASQRGSSANAGLIARQAAQQGAATQQEAIGQSSLMQAQQQISAMNALQGQQANMANLATNQVSQQAGALQNWAGGVQGQQSNFLNAATNMQANVNNANASIAGINAQSQNKLGGGFLGGFPTFTMAKGGEVPSARGYAGGGGVQLNPVGGMPQIPQASSGNFDPAKMLTQYTKISHMLGTKDAPPAKPGATTPPPGGQEAMPTNGGELSGSEVGGSAVGEDAAAGEAADVASGVEAGELAEGESSLGLLAAAHGGGIPKKHHVLDYFDRNPILEFSYGSKVPGKAQTKGDSTANDKVPVMLSPGEIVVPRSKASNPDQAAAFAKRISMKKGRK